jgi:hypothetical protein
MCDKIHTYAADRVARSAALGQQIDKLSGNTFSNIQRFAISHISERGRRADGYALENLKRNWKNYAE